MSTSASDGSGPQLNRYKVLNDLDDIGWGRRYLAEDTLHGRKVHLHLLPADVVMDASYVTRLREDVEASARLNDMNILRVFSLERDQARFVLVTEPGEGETLEARVRRDGVLPPDEATAIVIQIARGLHYAHRQGCAHGSLRPSKIVMAGGMAKIRDLGLTMPPDAGTDDGSEAYAPPEQSPGGSVFDVRADLYSLGAIFYRLAAGASPSRASDTEGLPDPRDLRPSVTDGMADVIRRLMARKREHRYEDCGVLLGDLEAVIDGFEPKTPAIDPAQTVISPPRKPRPSKTPAPAPLPPAETAAQADDEDTRLDLPALSGPTDGSQPARPIRPRKRPLAPKPAIRVPVERPAPPPPPPPEKEDDSDAVDQMVIQPIQASVEKVRRAAPIVAAGSRKAASWAARATRTAARYSQARPKQAAALAGGAALLILILVLLLSGGPAPETQEPKRDAPDGRTTAIPAPPAVDASRDPAVVGRPDVPAPPADRGKPAEAGMPVKTAPKAPVPPPVDFGALSGEAWMRAVQALPPEEQVRRVVERLRTANPAYDGRETHAIAGGRVRGIFLVGAGLKDIAPVRALAALEQLGIGFTGVTDLAPLRGLPLVELVCPGAPIRDLAPLAGMPLARLDCRNLSVDLRPVGACPLKEIACDFRPGQDTVVLRAIASLERINGMPARDFWASADEAAALAVAGDALAADPAWANAVDLLAMVDPGKDAVAGTWSKQGGGLVCDGSAEARVELPYVVPEEYDFRVRFTRREGSGEVVQIVSRSKRSFAWQMGAEVNTRFGFATTLTGGEKPPDRRMAWCLENGRSYTAVVKVRAVGVAVTINGREVVRWMNDLSGVGPVPSWTLKHPTVLGLGSHGSATVFHQAQVLAVKGEGWPLRMPPAAEGEGSGLKGEYFVGKYLEGTPVMTRVDRQIDFDWDLEAPDSRVPADSFSVRWTGALLAPHTGRWTFTTQADDGVRLWVNDQLLIDDWNRSGRARENSGTIQLQSGRRYAIRLEFVEYRASATVRLKWSGPGTPPAVIPKRQLYPES